MKGNQHDCDGQFEHHSEEGQAQKMFNVHEKCIIRDDRHDKSALLLYAQAGGRCQCQKKDMFDMHNIRNIRATRWHIKGRLILPGT
jgi:hypothetical protein